MKEAEKKSYTILNQMGETNMDLSGWVFLFSIGGEKLLAWNKDGSYVSLLLNLKSKLRDKIYTIERDKENAAKNR